MREWVKKVKGLRSTGWELQTSHGDVKFSIGNIVSNIVMTIMVPGGCVLEILRETFCTV